MIKSMQEYFFINTRNKRHSKVPLVDNFKAVKKKIIHKLTQPSVQVNLFLTPVHLSVIPVYLKSYSRFHY